MAEHPSPLVPPFVDLTDFDYMPLYWGRLFDSDTWIECDAEQKVAALRAWCKAWHQIPAGSLPNRPRVLANLLGYGVAIEAFEAIRAKALSGWILCSDERLYHPFLCGVALDSWHAKQLKMWDSECDRIRYFNKDKKEEDQLPKPDKPKKILVRMPEFTAGITVIPGGKNHHSGEIPVKTPSNRIEGNIIEGIIDSGGGSGARAMPTEAKSLVIWFEGLREELWPTEARFPAPTVTLEAQAQAFIGQGAPIPLLMEVIERGMRTAAAEHRPATNSLKAFKDSIMNAIVNHRQSLDIGGANGVRRHHDTNRPSPHDSLHSGFAIAVTEAESRRQQVFRGR